MCSSDLMNLNIACESVVKTEMLVYLANKTRYIYPKEKKKKKRKRKSIQTLKRSWTPECSKSFKDML